MSIQALREQRAACASKLNALMKDTEGKTWENSHQEQYDSFCAEIESIDAKIVRVENVLNIEAASANEIRAIAGQHGISDDHAAAVKAAKDQMFVAWLRDGQQGLNAEQQRIQQSRFLEVKNVMSTGTASEGGYTVQTEMARSISEAMSAYGGMRKVAEIFRTESGAALPFPTSDGTSEEGEIIPENGSATDEDPNFGIKSLATQKFSSKVIAIPFELLQDSAFDMESFARGRIEQRLGRITNRMYTTGTGSGQPMGVVTASALGKAGATGKSTSVDLDDLTDLEHSVDPVYRESGSCGYMFHDTTLRDIKKLKDTTGRPLWLPGHDVGAPDMINGKPYTINQHMPVMAANAKSILFGDFSHYKIRDVMAMLMFRFTDSAYAKKGQIGLMAWMRSGGNLVDVGGAVKHFQNSAT